MLQFDAAIAALARTQYGNFTLEQARALGATRDVVRTRCRSRVWRRVHYGVYKLAGVPDSWRSRAHAACLTHSLGLAAALAAGHLWGLDGFGPVGMIDVTIPRHTRPRRQLGIRYHETLAYDLAGATTRFGIPVTGPARTVLDICGVTRDPDVALAALDDVLRRRLATWASLWECLILHACRGRNGIVLYRQVLVKRWGKTVPHGKFARLFERLIEDAGIPAGVHEFKIGRYRVDMAYPLLKIVIELDGRDPHAREAAFEADRIRRNWLETQGWMVLNVTWDRLINDPAGIVAEIRDAIALRSGVR